MTEAFIHGFLLSAGLILPLGVQNLFIFNQGVTQPSVYKAFPAVLTAAVCDTFLILLAVLGTAFLVEQFEWLHNVIYIAGIVFLLYIAWAIWREEPQGDGGNGPITAKKQVVFALSVSLLNPHAFLDTFGVIGTNSLLYDGDALWMFTLAAILVSWLYFFLLAFAGGFIRRIDKDYRFRKLINKISAATIFGIAVYMILQLI